MTNYIQSYTYINDDIKPDMLYLYIYYKNISYLIYAHKFSYIPTSVEY